jgi:F-type H+-transporting ATPase subunit delta
MRISKQARRHAKQLLNRCLVEGELDEERVRQVSRRVLEERPRGYGAILAHFRRLLKLEIDRRTAHVESAAPLPQSLQNQLRERLTARYGRGLYFYFATQPELLGGLRIRVGSDVYDASIRGRLDNLRQAF